MRLISSKDAITNHGDHEDPRHLPSPTINASFLSHTPFSIFNTYLCYQPQPSASTSLQPKQDSVTTHEHETPASRNNATPPTNDASSMFSGPASSCSSAAHDKPKKRITRSKTTYLIAKPAVKHRTKLHIRPKVLMQLHQVLPSQRPKPVYEVVPFSRLAQRFTKHLARSFNTREKLGPNDLMIVKAEAYSNEEEEENWTSPDIIGVITVAKQEKGVDGPVDICLGDRMSRWEVTNLPNGNYEFNTTDDHGLMLRARWVHKPSHTRRRSNMVPSSPVSTSGLSVLDDTKFTFSTISTNSRRHPIIATMIRSRIDVLDSYAMPSATSPSAPGLSPHNTPVLTPSDIDKSVFLDTSASTLPIKTDDALRRFIVVSGIWVALQNFTLKDHESSPLITAATFRAANRRSLTQVDSPRSLSPASTVGEGRRSIPRLFRSGTDGILRSTSFTAPSVPAPYVESSPQTSPSTKPRSSRANSTGATQLHSATGSLRNSRISTFEDQALGETEEEGQTKRSVEICRNKGLGISPSPERHLLANSIIGATQRHSLATIPSSTFVSSRSDDPIPPAPLSAPLISSSQPLTSSTIPKDNETPLSAFSPVITTGLWDSGVMQGSGLKSRTTSLLVSNERKKKQEKRREQSKSKDDRKQEKRQSVENAKSLGLTDKADWYKYKIKMHLKRVFSMQKA